MIQYDQLCRQWVGKEEVFENKANVGVALQLPEGKVGLFEAGKGLLGGDCLGEAVELGLLVNVADGEGGLGCGGLSE